MYGWLPVPLYFQFASTDGRVDIIFNAERMPTALKFNFYPQAGADKADWFFRFKKHQGFGWWLDITIPHWFLIALSAAFAALPWLPWSNRFSLRTLLIATTVIALVLGMLIVVAR